MTAETFFEQFVCGGIIENKPIFICDSKYFLVSTAVHIKVCVTSTGKVLHYVDAPNTKFKITHTIPNPKNEEQIYFSDSKGDIFLWNAEKNAKINEWKFEQKIEKFLLFEETFFIQSKKKIYSFTLKEKKKEIIQEEASNFHICQEHSLLFFTNNNVVHQKEIKSKSLNSQKKEYLLKLKGNIEHFEISVQGIIAIKDSSSRSIQLFHPFEKEPFSLLTWHPATLNALCFSADGLYLFSGGDEGILVMWYLKDNQKTFHPTYTKIKQISVSDNLETYLFVSDTNFVGILDSSKKLKNVLQMKKMSNLLVKSENLVDQIIFKPNSNELLLNGSNCLQFYDLENDTENQIIDFQFKAILYDPSRFKYSTMVDSVIGNVSFTQNSKFIASSEMIGGKISLKFFELNEKKTYQLITAVDSPHTDKVNSILNHPNEDYFVSCSKDGFVKIWSFKNDSFICSGILSYRKLNPTSISFSKDGSLIAISFHNILTFWDLTELTMIHSMIHFHEIKKCLFLDDDSIIFNDKEGIHLYSIKSSMIVYSIELKDSSNLICDSKGNFSVLNGKTISIFNIQLNTSIPPLKKKIVTSSNVICATFKDEDLFYLNNSFDIFRVSKELKEKVHKEVDDKIFIETNLKETKPFQRSEEKLKLNAHDPDVGSGSWKPLLKGATHALTSTTNMYQSFMNGFLLKNLKENEMERKSEKNELKEMNQEVKKVEFNGDSKDSKEIFSSVGTKLKE